MADDIILNTNTEYSQDYPATAALAGGGFVAVWDDANQDAGFDGFTGVYGRVFDAQGRALTREFKVPLDDYNQQFSPLAVGLPDGGFAVAWESNGIDRRGADDGDFNVFLQRFSALGERIGAQRQITPDRDVDQRLQDLVSLPDGGFRAVYAASDVRTDWDVYTRRFDARSASVGGESAINANVDTGTAAAFRTLTPGYEILPLAGGGFVAAYYESPEGANGFQVYTRRHAADGAPVGPRTRVSEPVGFEDNDYPRIAGLAGGHYVVAWTNEDEDDLDDTDVYVRTYDAGGRALTGPLRVNDDLEEGQYLGAVVPLPDGGFLVTYASWYVFSEFPYDYYEVRGRTYDANGRPTSGTFDISEFIYEDMGSVGAIGLRDGGIVVTWHGGDIIEEDVFATVLAQGTAGDDAIAALVPGAYRGFTGDDRIVGTEYADALSGDAGDDRLFGGAGADALAGGRGDDGLSGGPGRDTASYDGAGAAVAVSLAAGRAIGGAGRDALAGVEDLVGSAFGDRLVGDAGANALAGLAGADRLAAGLGDDALAGGRGADLLTGHAGRDRLAGGAGADRFVWLGAGDTGADLRTADLVRDFERGRDRLDLSAIDINSVRPGAQGGFDWLGSGDFTGAKGELRYARADGDLFVLANTDGDAAAEFVIALEGVRALAAADFLL